MLDFDSFRPVVSGVIGGTIAVWLTTKWARWVPQGRGRLSADLLRRRYSWSTKIASTLFFSGIVMAIAMYSVGDYSRTDWRPGGLGFGFGALSPAVYLYVVARLRRRDPREAFTAFAIAQQCPMGFIYAFFVLGSTLFFASAVSLVV